MSPVDYELLAICHLYNITALHHDTDIFSKLSNLNK